MTGADKRGRYHSTSQYPPDTAMGDTRPFARLWDYDAAGSFKPDHPLNDWARGQIVRRSQPAFVLTSLGPSLDAAGPAAWRPNI